MQPPPSRQILVSRTSRGRPSPTSPKDPIWPSRGRPDLMSSGRPEMTSRGRPTLTSMGRPWEVGSGRPRDLLRTFPRGPSKHALGRCWSSVGCP